MNSEQIRAAVFEWMGDGTYDLADIDGLTSHQQEVLQKIQDNLNAGDRYRELANKARTQTRALRAEADTQEFIMSACIDAVDHRRNIAARLLDSIAPKGG